MSFACPLCPKNSLKSIKFATLSSLEIHLDIDHGLNGSPKLDFEDLTPDSETKLDYFLHSELKRADRKLRSKEVLSLPSVQIRKIPKADSKIRLIQRENSQLRMRCLSLEDDLTQAQTDYEQMSAQQNELKRQFDTLNNFLQKSNSEQLKGRRNLEGFISNLLEENEELEVSNQNWQQISPEPDLIFRKRAPSVADSGYVSTPVVGTPKHLPRSSTPNRLPKGLPKKDSTLPKIPMQKQKIQMNVKIVQNPWEIIFGNLDSVSLLLCAAVCTEWRTMVSKPIYWQRVQIENCKISLKALKLMSIYCSETQAITICDVKASKVNGAKRKAKGALDNGIERILKFCGQNLQFLKISNTGTLVSDRVLWMCGCHNPNLNHLIYLNDGFPISAGVIWSLGSGCKNLHTLSIAPESSKYGENSSLKCDDETLKMVAKCWGKCIEKLAIGGNHFSPKGIAILMKTCECLELLELHFVKSLSESDFNFLSKQADFRQLKQLGFVHCRIWADVVYSFYKNLPNVEKLSVITSEDDFDSPLEYDDFCIEIEQIYRRDASISRVLRLSGLEDTSIV